MRLNVTKEIEAVVLQILYLFVIPTLLLYFKIIPGNYRFVIFITVSLFLYGIILKNKWTHEDVGIKRNWMSDWLPYSLFTIAGSLFLFWLSQIIDHEPFLNWWENKSFLLLFLPVSVLQEVVFRGILMKMLLSVSKRVEFAIIINALIFTMLHVIYVNATFVLPLTFIAGIGFAWIFYKYKNLVLISISHTILNFMAMILGFFVLR